MTLRKKIKHLVLGVAAFTMSMSASAIFGSGIVYDPTNWIQNYNNAISQVKQEVTAAKALIQQTQTAIDTAKSIKNLKNMDSLAQVKEGLRLYTNLRDVDLRLERDFQQSAALTESLTSKYGASDMSWNDFLQSKDKIDRQQRDTAAQRFKAINASMDQTARQRQAIVSQLGSVQGQTEAMQTVGAAVDVLIGQNQQMIHMLKVESEVKVLEKKQEENYSNIGIQKMNAHQQRLRESAARFGTPASK
jgi:hypothetical protein